MFILFYFSIYIFFCPLFDFKLESKIFSEGAFLQDKKNVRQHSDNRVQPLIARRDKNSVEVSLEINAQQIADKNQIRVNMIKLSLSVVVVENWTVLTIAAPAWLTDRK